MICHLVRIEGLHIFYAKFVDKKLRKFVDTGKQRVDRGNQVRVSRFSGHLGIVISDHGHTGGGRDADDLGIFEHPKEVAHQRNTIWTVAGVVMHLAATCLRASEFHLVSETLQDLDNGDAGLWKQRVVVAGDEQ
jgi:hypothetical protein